MSDTEESLTRLVRQGDAAAFEALLARYRPRLARLVATRIDCRLNARVDPSDVVQDTMIQAVLHRQQFHGDIRRSFYAWLREIACNRLVDLKRRHLGAERRSVLREIPLQFPPLNEQSNLVLAQLLADSGSSPVRRLERNENLDRLQNALQQLGPIDRELLIMRHLEQMSTEDIAEVLQISRTNVATRHLRALQRLQHVLSQSDQS